MQFSGWVIFFGENIKKIVRLHRGNIRAKARDINFLPSESPWNIHYNVQQSHQQQIN